MGDFISYELLPIVFNMSVTASVAILFVLLTRLLLKKAPKIFSPFPSKNNRPPPPPPRRNEDPFCLHFSGDYGI